MEGAVEVIGPMPVGTSVRKRIDPRTGKEMLFHPRSFWEEHERRRQASGLTISQYCEQEGLALSTLRRWSARLQGRETNPSQNSQREAKALASATGFLSVPLVPERNDAGRAANAHDAQGRIEVLLRSGARVRFFGAAADCVIATVMAELAVAR